QFLVVVQIKMSVQFECIRHDGACDVQFIVVAAAAVLEKGFRRINHSDKRLVARERNVLERGQAVDLQCGGISGGSNDVCDSEICSSYVKLQCRARAKSQSGQIAITGHV